MFPFDILDSELFTWVALVRHIQIPCARPVDQVEVNVSQVQLSQAVEGSLHGPLPLILRAQLTAGRRGLLRLVLYSFESQILLNFSASIQSLRKA